MLTIKSYFKKDITIMLDIIYLLIIIILIYIIARFMLPLLLGLLLILAATIRYFYLYLKAKFGKVK